MGGFIFVVLKTGGDRKTYRAYRLERRTATQIVLTRRVERPADAVADCLLHPPLAVMSVRGPVRGDGGDLAVFSQARNVVILIENRITGAQVTVYTQPGDAFADSTRAAIDRCLV